MPQFSDSLLRVFADETHGVRVDRETEPDYPEAPATFDVYFWKEPRVQTCPDGTQRYATKADKLTCLTRSEAEALVRTLREALDYPSTEDAPDAA